MTTVYYNNEPINIYWYDEAEQLIKQLANQYEDDITEVSKKGKGRNKVYYYNYPCAFDIETTTIKAGELDYIGTDDSPPIAFPYLFQWNIYGKVIMARTYKQSLNIFKWLAQYFGTGDNTRLILFDHNLGYEHQFYKGLWDIVPEKCFAIDEHHPLTILLKNGLMFRDSMKLSNMGLELLTKDWSKHYFKAKEIMNYSQLRTPYSILDHDTLLYSALDVLSLSEAIYNFITAKGENIWTNCPTSTSFIRKQLKTRIGVGVKHRTKEQKKYFNILAKQAIDAEQYELLTELFRGGNTHCNRKYTGQYLEGLLHFDIISAHPCEMVCEPEYPVGVWHKFDKGVKVSTMELFEKSGYCTMFKIALINARIKKDIPVPYISISKMQIIKGSNMNISDNGRYLGGLDVISVSIFGVEWPIIKSQYDFDNAVILKGWFAYKSYLPDIIRNFILELYAKKTELKHVPDKELEYALAKIDLNGCYGMTATNPIIHGFDMTNNDIIPKEEKNPSEVLLKYQNSTSYFTVWAWGAMTSALTRIYLQRMIDCAGWDNFVYCDTDSIFAINTPEVIERIKAMETDIIAHHRKCGLNLIYYDVNGKPHELGALDREPDVHFKSWGAKKYITVENGILKCTVAGVPKKKGAEIIGTPDNFKLGLNFSGTITGKQCLWYNEPLGYKLHDEQGREIDVNYNIAMLPCDYLLSISQDYRECLSINNNFHWFFTEVEKDGIIET